MMKPPESVQQLLAYCAQIEGLSFAQLAKRLNYQIPASQLQRKGWMGGLIEFALGADAKTQAKPDFSLLDIELKTIPVNQQFKPCESTYVTTVAMTNNAGHWLDSPVYHKLKHVLWVPVEGDKQIPYQDRRIGRAILHQPDMHLISQLKQDWLELTEMIALGDIATINASYGTYLHIRPKAAHGKVLCDSIGVEGTRIKTLPRGFYLRSQYTQTILAKDY